MKPASSRRYPRTARVNELLREVIAEELERIVSDDGEGHLITITGVDADPDLRNAKVHYSSLQHDAGEYLESSRVAIQACIGKEVRMKRTPHLTFVVDPAIVAGSRIEEIIGELHRDD